MGTCPQQPQHALRVGDEGALGHTQRKGVVLGAVQEQAVSEGKAARDGGRMREAAGGGSP